MAGLVGFSSLLTGAAAARLGCVRTVLIVLFHGVQSLDVTGPLEVFAAAAGPDGGPAYRVRTASLGGVPVRTASGLGVVPDGDLAHPGYLFGPGGSAAPDLLIVPGGEGTRRPHDELVHWLRAHAAEAGRVASVCTGAFLLAEAGLLDGRRVTTHWAHCAALRRQYPAVDVDPDPIFIVDGRLATSAGVTAGIDLALALVEEDLGRDEALAVARQLVVFLRRPGNQAQFSAQLQAQVAQRGPLRDLQQWIAEHPGEDLSVAALADRASLSPRHFARAFAAEVGMPPGRYVERVRLEAARRHLEDTAAGVEQAARACGYRTTEAMRRAFIGALGVSPAEYRRRFRPAPPDPGRPDSRRPGPGTRGPGTREPNSPGSSSRDSSPNHPDSSPKEQFRARDHSAV
jgi:transcriptional regulator GlxA family with amidase domain